MKRFNFSKAIIPNSFTAGNLLSGFLSIIFASQGDFRLAAILILIGAIFDAVDGLVARMIGTSSLFGVELDSLADIVTFGIAPGVLIYSVYLHELGYIGMLIAALIPLFGAFRLARFNIQVEDLNTKIDFRGLPIPATAMIVASMTLSYSSKGQFEEWFIPFIIPIIVITSLLMISDIRYDALPDFKKKPRKVKKLYFLIFILVILLELFTLNEVLFFVIFGFVLFGILRKLFYSLFASKFPTK